MVVVDAEGEVAKRISYAFPLARYLCVGSLIFARIRLNPSATLRYIDLLLVTSIVSICVDFVDFTNC